MKSKEFNVFLQWISILNTKRAEHGKPPMAYRITDGVLEMYEQTGDKCSTNLQAL